jgi:hypothetical protein
MDVGVRITLKWILQKYTEVDWIHTAQVRGKWMALVKHCNEPSGSIKCWEILE